MKVFLNGVVKILHTAPWRGPTIIHTKMSLRVLN